MVFQVFTIINLLAVTSQFSTRPTTTMVTPLHSAEENGPSLPPAGIWDGEPAEVQLSDNRWCCCFQQTIVNFGKLKGNKSTCQILQCCVNFRDGQIYQFVRNKSSRGIQVKSNTATPQHCNNAVLQYCKIAILQYRNTAISQYCNTAALQHCNTATLQHCNTAILQYRNLDYVTVLQYCAVQQHSDLDLVTVLSTAVLRNTATQP